MYRQRGAQQPTDDLAAAIEAQTDVIGGGELALHRQVVDEDRVTRLDAGLLCVDGGEAAGAADAVAVAVLLPDAAEHTALDHDAAAGFECGGLDHATDLDVAAGVNAHAGLDVSAHTHCTIVANVAGRHVDRVDGEHGFDHHAAPDL